MATMYDSTRPAGIPAGATLIAAYVDGEYANEAAMRGRFPNARIVRITVFGQAGIQVIDCEKGNVTPQQAAAWALAEIRAGRRPTIYCSLSWHKTVSDALAVYGLQLGPDVDWWCADYLDHPFLEAGSVATQWADMGSYDVSETNGVWPDLPATPPPLAHATTDLTWTDPQEGPMARRELTVPVVHGNGWVVTDIPFASWTGAEPTINAADPATDGHYTAGTVNCQDRGNMLLVELVDVTLETPDANGDGGFTNTPVTGPVLVFIETTG